MTVSVSARSNGAHHRPHRQTTVAAGDARQLAATAHRTARLWPVRMTAVGGVDATTVDATTADATTVAQATVLVVRIERQRGETTAHVRAEVGRTDPRALAEAAMTAAIDGSAGGLSLQDRATLRQRGPPPPRVKMTAGRKRQRVAGRAGAVPLELGVHSGERAVRCVRGRDKGQNQKRCRWH